MYFLIKDSLINPPTSIICFRDLTFWIHYDYRSISDILIESEKQNIDFYWKYLKKFGAMDFITDFVQPETEVGLRLAEEPIISPTIQAVYINEKNVFNILRAVGYN